MARVSSKHVDQLIDTKIVSKAMLLYAIKVELEHGKRFGAVTNIINDDVELAFRIALAHLNEFSNYYAYLERMEAKLDAYWSSRTKNLFSRSRIGRT